MSAKIWVLFIVIAVMSQWNGLFHGRLLEALLLLFLGAAGMCVVLALAIVRRARDVVWISPGGGR